MKISFNRKYQHGMEVYFSPDSDNFSIINLNGVYYIRIRDVNHEWKYPTWKTNKFKKFEDAQSWLNLQDWRNATDCYIEYDDSIFMNTMIVAISDRQAVLAAINTKDLSKNLVKVRSSNVWAYGLNIKDRKDKTGDLVVQFKNKNGGAGDVYIYYDVPIVVYRRWQSAPSKGHYFWVYIRNNFKYSKLTGDKRGKLANAIN